MLILSFTCTSRTKDSTHLQKLDASDASHVTIPRSSKYCCRHATNLCVRGYFGTQHRSYDVSIKPGDSEFTLMLFCASSHAMLRAICITAALLVLYGSIGVCYECSQRHVSEKS
ncbi:hypothetical protein BDR04DRAFT_424670 [Suillus decipiens]|nr:hypothetical protein BDR04DRAFT_424670 [Suillus decipiens]